MGRLLKCQTLLLGGKGQNVRQIFFLSVPKLHSEAQCFFRVTHSKIKPREIAEACDGTGVFGAERLLTPPECFRVQRERLRQPAGVPAGFGARNQFTLMH